MTLLRTLYRPMLWACFTFAPLISMAAPEEDATHNAARLPAETHHTLYSMYDFDAQMAVLEANLAAYGPPSLTATQHSELQALLADIQPDLEASMPLADTTTTVEANPLSAASETPQATGGRHSADLLSDLVDDMDFDSNDDDFGQIAQWLEGEPAFNWTPGTDERGASAATASQQAAGISTSTLDMNLDALLFVPPTLEGSSVKAASTLLTHRASTPLAACPAKRTAKRAHKQPSKNLSKGREATNERKRRARQAEALDDLKLLASQYENVGRRYDAIVQKAHEEAEALKAELAVDMQQARDRKERNKLIEKVGRVRRAKAPLSKLYRALVAEGTIQKSKL